jgi:hypothetical protein
MAAKTRDQISPELEALYAAVAAVAEARQTGAPTGELEARLEAATQTWAVVHWSTIKTPAQRKKAA